MIKRYKLIEYMYQLILLLAFAGVMYAQLYVDYSFNDAIVTTNYYALILSVAIFAPLCLLCYSKKFKLQMSDILIVSLVIFMIFNSKDGLRTEEVVMSLAYCILYFSLRIVNSRFENFAKLISIVILIFGIQQSILVLKQVYGLAMANNSNFLVSGDFFNPGPCGIFLGAVLVLAVSIIRKSDIDISNGIIKIVNLDTGRCVIAYIAMSLTLIAVVPTLSRAGWLGALVGAFFIYYKDIIENIKLVCHKINVSFKVVTIVISILVSALLFGVYLMKQDSADGRLFMWQNTITAFTDSPIIGIGVGNFEESYAKAQTEYFQSRDVLVNENSNINVVGVPRYPFNESLAMLLALGVLGAVLGLAILWFKLFRSPNNDYKAMIIAILVASLFSYTFYIPIIVFVFTFGMASLREAQQLKISKFVTPGIIVIIPMLFYISILGVKDEIDANKEWKEVSMFYSFKDYEIVIEESVKLEPYLRTNSDFLFEYGLSLNKCGRYEDSNLILFKGIECSADPIFLTTIGNNYLELKDYKKSEEAYLKSFYLCPNRLYPMYLLTKLYKETKDTSMMQYYGNLLLNKKPKIKSIAVNEMKSEITKILDSQYLNESIIKKTTLK